MKSRLKNIFLEYTLLFKDLKKEGIGKSLTLYVFFAFILLLINWILLYYNLIPANLTILKQLSITTEIFWQIPIAIFFVNVITLLFFGEFTVIAARIFKEKTKYAENVKIFAHASVPFMLTAWLSAFNAIFFLWSVYLTTRGIEQTNKIRFKKAFFIVVLAGIFTAVIGFLLTTTVMMNYGVDLDIERMFLTRV